MIENIRSPLLMDAMDANMAAYWLAYGRGDGCSLQQVGADTSWFYTGVSHPLFNGVPGAILNEGDAQVAIDGLQAKINAHGAPAFWWLGPNSQPEDLPAILERNGLEPVGEVPGMAMNLKDLDSPLPEIAGFTVEKVAGPEQQGLWARIAAIGTGFPEEAINAMEKVEASLGHPEYRAQHRYVGYLNGKPVASTALVLEAGVAGVYAIATLPEARQRGIGRTMTLLPLLEAQKMGYHVAILQASPMGYPLYKKLGFIDICSYSLFLQSKK